MVKKQLENELIFQPHRLFALKPLLLVMSAAFVTACSSTPKEGTAAYYSKNRVSIQNSHASQSNSDDMEELLSASDMQAVESNRVDVLRYGDMWQRMRAGFGLNLQRNNSRIDAQKNWFIARQPYINRLSARASRYIYYTVAEAERRGIPTELALLPVIESSYDPTATSNAAAAGMWQFIPSTGRIYGLRQTNSYDGRRDVIESTRAAYDFLTSLYNKFGSWELALAAYNCGPGCVNRAIKQNRKRGRATDYWSLKLPKETMNYVPRFLAVAKIVQSPQQFGVYLPSIANRPHFRSVPIQGGVALGSVSRLTGLSLDTLYDLNPALSQGVTDVEGPNRLLVPTSLSYKYDGKISELKGYGYNTLAASDTRLHVQTLDSNEAASLMSSTALIAENRSSKRKSNTTYTASSTTDTRAEFYKNKHKSLPRNSAGLAEFAAQSRVPNQNITYIEPKKVVTTVPKVVVQPSYQEGANVSSQPKPNVKVNASPLTTKKQKEQTKALSEINALPTSAAKVTKNETVVQYPAISQQERRKIVAEIKQADPSANVIDPLDGEIKLDAIQTQQSVLAAQGKEKKLTFKAPETKPKTVTKRVIKPTGKRTVYKVQSGDSLKKIGERFGLSWRDIANWNQIDPTASLYVGTPLYLYGAKAVKPAPKPTSYRVQSGDTMIGVANKFGLSASELAKLNGMKALDDLIIGQSLSLVATKQSQTKVSTPTKTSTSRANATSTTKIYTVQPGDGLIQLAKRFGMSTAKLAKLNGISPTKDLYVGQRLKVPASVKTTRPTRYTVQRGDTMIGVANKFDLSASQLAKRNGMKALDNLVVGQTLSLVDNARATDKSTKSQSQKPTKKETQQQTKKKPTSYVVESGDTMIYVARKFKLTTNNLAKWNGMKPTDDLLIGQRLTLVNDGKFKPSSNKTSQKSGSQSNKKKPTSYVVESGDTMIYVARKFKLSTNNLAKWNGMKPTDDLRIGQKLTLVNNGKGASKPTKSSSNKKPKYTSYKVKSGDGLIALARKYGISTSELAKLNNMKPTDSLQLGKTIKVPAK